MTPYYDDGTCTIYHGDCREVLPDLTGDLVLTDPPHNVGMKYGLHDDRMAPDAYHVWCFEWFRLCMASAPRVALFPGLANLAMWFRIAKPSRIGCWYKPGATSQSSLGWDEWEPWLYWGKRLGGSSVIRAPMAGDEHVHYVTGDHPCPKPPGLMRKLMVKIPGHLILDPFMGSGTTLRAAKDLDRKAIGIEIEERDCEVAAKRLGQEVLALS